MAMRRGAAEFLLGTRMRKRIDRFVEDALIDFGDWFVSSKWFGKERDCVNLFAHDFLSRGIERGAAIEALTQVRIESPAPQPKGYANKTAAKDLVIWKDGLSTVWNQEWQVRNTPWVVMEWKCQWKGSVPLQFNQHDVEWLSGFTREYAGTFGYLVRVYHGSHGRVVAWAKVRRGAINGTNKRS